MIRVEHLVSLGGGQPGGPGGGIGVVVVIAVLAIAVASVVFRQQKSRRGAVIRTTPTQGDQQWLDTVLAPTLADVATRTWTEESLREFVNQVADQINAAAQCGQLSIPAGTRQAWSRVQTAFESVPGVRLHNTQTYRTEVRVPGKPPLQTSVTYRDPDKAE